MTPPPSTLSRSGTLVLCTLVAAVLIGALVAGVVLDGQLGTRPILTLVCSLVAVNVAMLLVYRAIGASIRGLGPSGQVDEAT